LKIKLVTKQTAIKTFLDEYLYFAHLNNGLYPRGVSWNTVISIYRWLSQTGKPFSSYQVLQNLDKIPGIGVTKRDQLIHLCNGDYEKITVASKRISVYDPNHFTARELEAGRKAV